MKKTISLLLCLTLLLAGCGMAEAPTEPPLNMGGETNVGTEDAAKSENPVIPESNKGQDTTPKSDRDYSQDLVYSGATTEYLEPMEDYSWTREFDPEFVMLHFTSAVVIDQEDPYNMEKIRGIFEDYHVSIHYLIDREGNVHCFIPENRVAWHAGEGSFLNDPKYTDKMNLYSVGIELMGIGTKDEMKDYLTAEQYDSLDESDIGFTDAQYETLKVLVPDICQRHGIPMDHDHVIGHEDFANDLNDPGRLFDWNRLLG